MKLLTEQYASPKLAKSGGDFVSAVLYLAPARLSGYTTCPAASPGCIKACLNTAGRGRFTSIQQARIRKTLLYMQDRAEFLALLRKDLTAMLRRAERTGKQAVVRLNGTSDLDWISSGLFEEFSSIQFYDYTKVLRRIIRLKLAQRRGRLLNYHLTFSRSELNENECLKALSLGVNVAVVFKHELPSKYLGHRVVDGDTTDYRFLDKASVIVGLTAKGLAKRDHSDFVVDLERARTTRYQVPLHVT